MPVAQTLVACAGRALQSVAGLARQPERRRSLMGGRSARGGADVHRSRGGRARSRGAPGATARTPLIVDGYAVLVAGLIPRADRPAGAPLLVRLSSGAWPRRSMIAPIARRPPPETRRPRLPAARDSELPADARPTSRECGPCAAHVRPRGSRVHATLRPCLPPSSASTRSSARVTASNRKSVSARSMISGGQNEMTSPRGRRITP
jgi:hypothetical protein